MADLLRAIPQVRDGVAALLRIHLSRPATVKKGREKPAVYEAAMVGTAFCIVADRLMLTAHHVFNNGQPRRNADKFYALVVPQNGPRAYHFPVIAFPFEEPRFDFAVVELGACNTPGVRIPALPLTTRAQPDGAHVATVGFPSPLINALNVDNSGGFVGGDFFLKSHANEGIVSAQYEAGGIAFYELNVGWHHGESGGPIASLDDPVGVFSMMQRYRDIQTPHGKVAGPHMGAALRHVEGTLRGLGATFV